MEFQTWPKTTRLMRDIVVSEKIDGTNSAIIFEETDIDAGGNCFEHVIVGYETYCVGAQSRNRLIYPSDWKGDKSSDNAGFARWVRANAEDLFSMLGPGRHFGEWWGQGIQRNYGLDHKRFSLFNTDKWSKIKGESEVQFVGDAAISGVPVLYEGVFSEDAIKRALVDLQELGSHASPGFPNAEGVCVYHTQSKQVYKVTLDNNDAGKWEA